MFARILRSLAPAVDSPEVAAEVAAAICEIAGALTPGVEVDTPPSFADAIELLLDEEVAYSPARTLAAIHAVFANAGITDLESSVVRVETGELYLGVPGGFTRLDATCGDWEAEFGAWGFSLVRANYRHRRGYYNFSSMSVGGVAGIWTDPSVVGEHHEAFGPGISSAGLTFEPSSDRMFVVQHVNDDGLVDAVFCYEEHEKNDLHDVSWDLPDTDLFS